MRRVFAKISTIAAHVIERAAETPALAEWLRVLNVKACRP